MGGRRRRRRGPGSASGANRGGRPRRRIIITRAGPTGQVNGPSPTIRAYVEDRYGTRLSRHDIDVYLDGNPKMFSYGPSSGRLTCPAGRLSSGTHTVEIVAHTDDGVGRKRWTFNVKK